MKNKMKNGRRISLQSKSLLLILVLFFLPFIMLSIFLYSRQSNSYRQQEILSEYSLTTQIGQNIGNLIYDIQQKSLLLYKEDSSLGFLQSEDKSSMYEFWVEAHLSEIQAYDRYISGITVVKPNGYFCSSSSYFDILSEQVDPSELDGSGRLHLIKEVKSNDDTSYLVLGRTIKNPVSLSDVIGYMYFFVRKDVFNNIVGSTSLEEAKDFYIYDKQASKFFMLSESNDSFDIINTYVDLSALNDGARYLNKKGSKMICSSFTLNVDGDLLLIHLSETKPIGEELKWLLLSLLSCAILMSIVFSVWFNSNIFRRLNKISKAMDNLEHDNFKTSIEIENNDEITLLTNSFNHMNKRLNELVNEIYASNLREKESTIKSLMAYINPHFFFNTLDTICWMSRQEEAYETCELIEALSKLFRLKLDNSKPIISVKEEIANVHEYLKIQECRFADRISFKFSCDDNANELLTVSSVIQPLIENAIYHGIENFNIEAEINTVIKIIEDSLYIEVSNTGHIPNVEQLNRILYEYKDGKKGLAIYSINRRIQLLYGEDYGLSFSSTNGRLIAVIKQPLRRHNDGL